MWRNYLKRKKRFAVGVFYVVCDFHLSLRGTKQSVPIFYILIISILFIVSLSVVEDLGVFCKKSKTKAKHFFTKPRFPLQSFFAIFRLRSIWQKKDFHCNRSREMRTFQFYFFYCAPTERPNFYTLFSIQILLLRNIFIIEKTSIFLIFWKTKIFSRKSFVPFAVKT